MAVLQRKLDVFQLPNSFPRLDHGRLPASAGPGPRRQYSEPCHRTTTQGGPHHKRHRIRHRSSSLLAVHVDEQLMDPPSEFHSSQNSMRFVRSAHLRSSWSTPQLTLLIWQPSTFDLPANRSQEYARRDAKCEQTAAGENSLVLKPKFLARSQQLLAAAVRLN